VSAATSTRKRIVVGITGASGAPYARRLLSVLAKRPDEVELAVCLSSTAREVWKLECGGDLEQEIEKELGLRAYGGRDYSAPFASGSAGWQAMVVVPCSMSSVAKIAHGISDTLLTRAADVMLKERRSLILVPRETPLSVVHLENMLTVSKAGALVLPAMPSFYAQPRSIEQVLDTVVTRICDHLGVATDLMKRWGSGESGDGASTPAKGNTAG
jgi:4-hydroxy-3-polyprenylbenzoate decarboxylase